MKKLRIILNLFVVLSCGKTSTSNSIQTITKEKVNCEMKTDRLTRDLFSGSSSNTREIQNHFQKLWLEGCSEAGLVLARESLFGNFNLPLDSVLLLLEALKDNLPGETNHILSQHYFNQNDCKSGLNYLNQAVEYDYKPAKLDYSVLLTNERILSLGIKIQDCEYLNKFNKKEGIYMLEQLAKTGSVEANFQLLKIYSYGLKGFLSPDTARALEICDNLVNNADVMNYPGMMDDINEIKVSLSK